MKKQMYWGRLLAVGLLGSSLALVGCSGDDGAAGAAGPAADTAELERLLAETQAARDAAIAATASTGSGLESCMTCHDTGAVYDTANYHALTNKVSFTILAQPVVDGDDLVISFNLKLDGTNNSSYTGVNRAVVMTKEGDDYKRYAFDRQADHYTITPSVTAGNYTVRILRTAAGAIAGKPDPRDFVGTDARYYLRLTGSGLPNASVSFAATEYTRPTLVSNNSCQNCHGENGGDGLFGHHTMPWKVEACTTCHSPSNPVGYGDYRSSLVALAHGIHNSYNMPGNKYTYNASNEWEKVTYPTYMNNCSVCHDSTDSLAAVNAAPVTFALCMSCHGSWAGYGNGTGVLGGINHNNMTIATNCAVCHDGTIAPATVAAMHNGSFTGRSGLIYNGADVSVVEGAKVDMQITGVSYEGSNMKVTWTTKYNTVAVNPCNTTVAVDAPIFHAGGAANTTTGQVAGNLSILRAYAQGDDWVNAGIGTSPGQPVSTNVATSNTVCAGNVATTTVALTDAEQATTASKGTVALQGKAQVKLGYTFDRKSTDAVEALSVIQVRSKTPTREFVVKTGAAPTARRAIIDTASCLGCHVGSLYQHSGNRIDNVDMCIMCHNEASSEQNVRVNDGVDASEAYDGKAGQTYGFKSLLHAIHSKDRDDGPITMVYRTNGIYVWAGKDTLIPNWPGTGAQTVYGSNPAGTNTLGTTRTHYLYHPTYPRKLQDCAACHKTGTFGVPDQAVSVATTFNAGVEPWSNQIDDVLISTSTAACTSCHQTASTRAHAYQNSFTPSSFSNGRQTILDAAK